MMTVEAKAKKRRTTAVNKFLMPVMNMPNLEVKTMAEMKKISNNVIILKRMKKTNTINNKKVFVVNTVMKKPLNTL